MEYSWALPALAVIPPTLAIFFNILSASAQIRNTKVQKTIDIMIECNRRFTMLNSFANEIELQNYDSEAKRREAAKKYYHSYWLLLWDQWVYFTHGFLPTYLYGEWIGQEASFFKTKPKILDIDYQEGWRLIRADQFISFEEFCVFVDFLEGIANDDPKTIERKIAKRLKQILAQSRKVRAAFQQFAVQSQ